MLAYLERYDYASLRHMTATIIWHMMMRMGAAQGLDIENYDPEEREAGTYAVVDTQFSATEWLSGERIDPAIQDRLATFNHVRAGGGYPELAGIQNLESEILAVERFGDDPPLISVEAKGQTGDGTVDT